MDVRRVQITGGSSFMITLPKDWANSVGLNKNDTIGVQAQADGTLLLYPRSTLPLAQKRTTKIIDVTDVRSLDFLHRELVGAYVVGHTTIMVKSDHPIPSSVTSTVSRFVRVAIGLEMIEADESHILIANLIEHEAVDVHKIIERMGMLIKELLADVYYAALTGDFEKISDMASRSSEIDRIFWLTARQYNISQKNKCTDARGEDDGKFVACLFISKTLERISDHLVGLTGFMKQVMRDIDDAKIEEETHRLGLMANDVLAKSLKSWLAMDIMMAEDAIVEADNLIEESEKMMVKGVSEGSVLDEVLIFTTILMCEHSKCIAKYTFISMMT